MTKLTKVHPNVYCNETPFTLFTCEIGNRMTVIELPNKRLWVHSPVKPTEDTLKTLSAMGELDAIVAPNLFHHMNATAFSELFPKATVYGVPGLQRKQKHLKFENLFHHLDTWAPSIEAKIVEGMPALKEVVFFHPDSKTLLVTDLIFNLQKSKGLSKWLLKLDGIDGKVAFSKLSKLVIKDKLAFKKSIQDIQSWDFETIVMSHGQVIQENAKALFEDALSSI